MFNLVKDGFRSGYILVTNEDQFKFYGYSYTKFSCENDEIVTIKLDKTEKFWFKNMHKWDSFDENNFPAVRTLTVRERLKKFYE